MYVDSRYMVHKLTNFTEILQLSGGKRLLTVDRPLFKLDQKSSSTVFSC